MFTYGKVKQDSNHFFIVGPLTMLCDNVTYFRYRRIGYQSILTIISIEPKIDRKSKIEQIYFNY